MAEMLPFRMHPTLNDVEAFSLVKGSNKEVTWEGTSCAHIWTRRIREQYRFGTCPYCAGSRVLAGFNDLATLYPDVAAEFSKNNERAATSYLAHSNEQVLWLCPQGHEYAAKIEKRTRRTRPTACSVCSNKEVRPGVNDLATTHPAIAQQWSDKNDDQPVGYTAGSHALKWWTCDQVDHEDWQNVIKHRTQRGQGCPSCAGNRVVAGVSDLVTLAPDIAAQWSSKNEFSPAQFSVGSEHNAIWVCAQGHEWHANINNRTLKKSGCPKCVASLGASRAEKEIANHLRLIGLTEIETNVRGLLGGQHEIDIYLPEHKVGIEYNGIYWHAEPYKDATSHHNKWQLAAAAGIQLIQIWEDDYQRSPALVHELLAHKLGLSKRRRVPARKTEVFEMSLLQAQHFATQYHIQGFASGSVYLGLREVGSTEIIALMILKKGAEGSWQIIRYATSVTVVGGFTKLLRSAEKQFKPTRWVTFSDNTISDGALYANSGFVAKATLNPDYMYVEHGNKRVHKFNYRRARFARDPALAYDENLSERALAALNGLTRIWDAGKIRWEKSFEQTSSQADI